MHQTQAVPRQFLRLPQVIAQTGLKRSSIYMHIQKGDFPKQIKLGPKAVGWDADEIAVWQAAKIAERDGKPIN